MFDRANEYQRAVLEFVRRGAGHGLVEATAGSGKTTTLVMVARLLVEEVLAEGERACFLAFNRSTAAELKARLPDRVEAQTLHSLGRGVLAQQRSGDVDLEQGKYSRLAAELLAGPAFGSGPSPLTPNHTDSQNTPATPTDTAELAEHLDALVGYARLELTEPANRAALHELRERYALAAPRPFAELDSLYGLVSELLEAGQTARPIDYTDMLYLPWRLDLPAPRYAFICVDEAQDLSPLALALVMWLVAAGARALFVGDPYQAIYAFAGADARSLQRIAELTAATRLPLSVSFRCPSRHVALARRFSPAMQAAPGAPYGRVRLIDRARLPRTVQPGDLVMTRTNAPLPGLALEIAAVGTPVRVLGHDFAEPALELATKLFGSENGGGTRRSPVDASVLTIVERSQERERLRLEDELLTSERLPLELKASRLTHATLALAVNRLLTEAGPHDDDHLGETIEGLFAPQQEYVLLATVHKAKGREADRTFLLHPELLGLHTAEAESLSEANVLFVALTRAKQELFLVEEQPGAVATRLKEAQSDLPSGLTRSWNDVLRLALIMARSATPRSATSRGLSSSDAQARRVQDSRRQAGGGRRRARWRPHRQGGGNR